MKASPPTAATALATLYAKDGPFVERSFSHMTGTVLRSIQERLLAEYDEASGIDSGTDGRSGSKAREDECASALARACVRRVAHRCLDKYAGATSFGRDEVEAALGHHELPPETRRILAAEYGGAPPSTWIEALRRLEEVATVGGSRDDGELWRMVLGHPMTAYVPVQCRGCGLVVPDEYPPSKTDDQVGLREVPPTGTELELRAGWFRGSRGAVTFELTCPACGDVSRWYRSGHPRAILDPHRWGRLCGEQEDLRLTLADYLGVAVRTVVPLDWDHVWSEYWAGPESRTEWRVQDDSARNFCRRLDEGIGSWTGVWALHPDPDMCADVTAEYLARRRDGGRADDGDGSVGRGDGVMERYRAIVEAARDDPSGASTQTRTANGYLLARAGLSVGDVTEELRRAARDHGSREWWRLPP